MEAVMKTNDNLKKSFTYNKEEVIKALKSNLVIIYGSIVILALCYLLLSFLPIRNGASVAFLLLAQGVLFVYQSLPLFKDLKNGNKDFLNFNGKVINRKGIFVTKLTIRDASGSKVKLLTDKKNIQLGDMIKGSCTRNAKVITSCSFKK
jgi:hypothetical protein